MEFLDKYLYWLTIPVIAVIVLLFILYKKQIIANKNIAKLGTFAFGLLLFGLQVCLIPMYAIQGRFQHSLMTDLCPFTSFFFGIALMMGKERWIKMIMPWALLGATLTIAASSPDFTKEGVASGLVSYLRHVAMFIAFFWSLINIKHKYEAKDIKWVYIYMLVFGVWILIGAGIPYWVTGDERWGAFSTGMLKPSWHEATFTYHSHGETKTETVGDYAFFATFGMPYPVTTILFYGVSSMVIFAIVTLINVYMKKSKVKHI